jgi:hypothetical protein
MTTGTSTNNVVQRDQDPYFKPMNAKFIRQSCFAIVSGPGCMRRQKGLDAFEASQGPARKAARDWLPRRRK